MSSKTPKHGQPPRRKKSKTGKPTSVFSDLPELERARALWQHNNRVEAIALFDKAVKENPANIPALVDASRTFGSLYQYAKATEFLRRAEEVGAASSNAMFQVGQSYRIIRRNDDAIRCLQKAIAKTASLPDAHLELAILFEKRNDLGKALNHCEARLKANNLDSECRFLKGRILLRMDQIEEAEILLNATASDNAVHVLTRGRCFTELAKLYEQTGQYKKAWEAMTKGKLLLLPHAESQRQHRQMLVPPMNQLAKDISEHDFQKWRNAHDSLTVVAPKPTLLTGLPRSGTTLLGQILNGHADITTADEFNLFSAIMFPNLLEMRTPSELTATELNGITETRLNYLRSHFISMFVAAIPNLIQSRILIDKNPSLLPFITPYIRLFPGQKIIVMLRDPRDVLVSCMMSYMPLNDFSVDFLELDTAVNRVESDVAIWLNVRDKLPEQCCIEVKYETLVDDFELEAKRLLSALGLPWSEDVKNYRNAKIKSEVFSSTYAEVANPIHSDALKRWHNYEQFLSPYLNRLEELATKLGYC
jgi:tetratricopeptide (TPR) repeat protein